MVVDEVMSSDPFVVSVTDTVGSAIKKLIEADVRHLPVVSEGELVGMVSDRDLRSFTPVAMLELTQPRELQARLAQPVSKVMTTDVISVNPETELAEVVDLMIEHKIGAVPVVEADSAKLVGIVSYIDALRAARDQF
jgi:acetoin utilization protein AcuB